MAIAHVQALGSNQSKAAGTSLAIAVASLSVTVGHDVFVVYAGDDVGSAFACNDNLGNAYSLRNTTILAGSVKAILFRSTITVGGTMTSITVSWTTNVTAKMVAAGQFSGVGTERVATGHTNPSIGSATTIVSGADAVFSAGDLLIGIGGHESPNTDNLTAQVLGGIGVAVEEAQNGTTGGGAASNICGNLCYCITTAGGNTTSQSLDSRNNTALRNVATSGGIYAPAAVAAAAPFPYTKYGYYPTQG